MLNDLHTGEEHIEVLGDDDLKGDKAHLTGGRLNRSSPVHSNHAFDGFGHLQAGEELLAGLRVTDDDG